ncbi:hypothetical protein GM418_14605 [Maribellus comscasis]|uniref:Tetratricopeptide repeat protein n=1 Tax=Maribellus comscasis TaxID=2681766 RepID=A0A6I6K0C8_9BACT|nr:hypothetical protein [Maribellus comscasis]QGY44853.1 hypothetical protein GM418_14605 [Maribellus comscasis]
MVYIIRKDEEKFAEFLYLEIRRKKLFDGENITLSKVESLIKKHSQQIKERKLPIISSKAVYNFLRNKTKHPLADTLHYVAIICQINPNLITDYIEDVREGKINQNLIAQEPDSGKLYDKLLQNEDELRKDIISKVISNIELLEINVEGYVKSREVLLDNAFQEKNELLSYLYKKINEKNPLSVSIKLDLEKYFIKSEVIEEIFLIAGALSTRLITDYDPEIADLLFIKINQKQDKIWKFCLVGLILGLVNNISDKETAKRALSNLKQITAIDQKARFILNTLLIELVEFSSGLLRQLLKIPVTTRSELKTYVLRYLPFSNSEDYYSQFNIKYEKGLYEALKGSIGVSDLLKHSILINSDRFKEKELEKLLKELNEAREDIVNLQNDYLFCRSVYEQKFYVYSVVHSIFYATDTHELLKEDLEKKISEFINEFERHDIRSTIAFTKSELSDYESLLRIHLRINPHDDEYWAKLGLYLLGKSNFEEGKECLNNVQIPSPNIYSLIFDSLKECLISKNKQHAIICFDTIGSYKKKNFNLATELMSINSSKEAITVLKEFSEVFPKDTIINLKIAECYNNIGDWDKSLDYFFKVDEKELSNDQIVTGFNTYGYHFMKQNSPKALECFSTGYFYAENKEKYLQDVKEIFTEKLKLDEFLANNLIALIPDEQGT